MAEPEDGMDLLLRRSMTSWAQPRLSATFDRRLARRLTPRGLPRAGRWVLALYAAAALLASVWVMRSAAID